MYFLLLFDAVLGSVERERQSGKGQLEEAQGKGDQ